MLTVPRFVAACAVIALCFALIPLGAPREAGAQPASPVVEGEVLVKFRPGTPGQEVANAHRAQQAQVRSTIPRIDVQVVQVPPGREVAAAAAYGQNPNVQLAEPNRRYEAITHGATYPNDARFDEQWQYRNTGQSGGTTDADIDAYEVWNTAGIKGSSSVNVAVIDTGVDSTHEDLAIARSRDFTGSGSAEDRYGHGTHVAGSVAAKTNNTSGVSGTCPQCSVWNYRVLDDSGSGQWDWIANGIVAAADDGAQVINLSLGGYSLSQTLELAVNHAWDAGVVIAAAAGNDGQNWGFYPGAYANSIAVGATDRKDAKASFSNYGGNWVDVAAPGADILSTAPKVSTARWGSGTGGYAPSTGHPWPPHTWRAWPGSSGRLTSASPKTTAASGTELRVRRIAHRGTGTDFRNFTAHGRINAAAAVGGASLSLPSPTVTSTPTLASTPDFRANSDSNSDTSSTPTLTATSISPSSVRVGGTVSVTISGAGFQPSAGVTFENGSGSTPVASNVSVAADGRSLTAQISVGSGGPRRERIWDVRVTNPGGASAALPRAFTVTP